MVNFEIATMFLESTLKKLTLLQRAMRQYSQIETAESLNLVLRTTQIQKC